MKSLKNNHIVTILEQSPVVMCDVPIYGDKSFIRHIFSVAQRQCPINTKNRFIVCVSVQTFDDKLHISFHKCYRPNVYVYSFPTLEECSIYIMESVETHLLRDYAQVSLWHENAVANAILSNFEHNVKYKYNRNFILSHIH